MKRNMGTADRFIRGLIAIGIAVLFFTNIINGILAVILGIIGIIFLITSTTGLCFLYIPFKAKTTRDVETSQK
jgi:Inner membrane protein YgaP-like, transmembrane domain